MSALKVAGAEINHICWCFGSGIKIFSFVWLLIDGHQNQKRPTINANDAEVTTRN